MNMPIILAHGVLGNFDEVIMLSIAAIFVVMMGVSWVKSRTMEFDDENSAEKENQGIDSSDAENDYFPLK